MLPEQAADVVCARMAFPGEANNFCLFFSIQRNPHSCRLSQPLCDELSQIPVIPEDIFFTSEFTEVAKLEEGDVNSAGLVSKTFNQVVFSPKMYKLW